MPQPPGPAGVSWVNSWGAPEFKIALFNNYKITPASIGGTYQYPLPPNNMWKKVTFDWNARLTIEGFTKGPTTAPPTPTPPAKKPCTPTSLGRWDDQSANIYLNEVIEFVPYAPTSKLLSLSPSELRDWIWKEDNFGATVPKKEFGVWLLCSSALFIAGGSGAREPLPIDQTEPLTKLVPPGGEYAYGDIASSPDVLAVQMQVQGGPGGVTKIRETFNAAGVKALRSGKPFPVVLTGTFRVKGKPPITVTKKITLQGPPPVAAISSVTVTGTPQAPSIVVHGTNLGSEPAPNPSGSPSNQPLCPVVIKGNAGLDYGTSLYLNDATGNFSAGRYRPTLNELDCIGLIVTKFTPTEVDFRPGSGYQQFSPKYRINDGDALEIAINGASKTVHVKYGTAVRG